MLPTKVIRLSLLDPQASGLSKLAAPASSLGFYLSYPFLLSILTSFALLLSYP
jgi:hypothetical protein